MVKYGVEMNVWKSTYLKESINVWMNMRDNQIGVLRGQKNGKNDAMGCFEGFKQSLIAPHPEIRH